MSYVSVGQGTWGSQIYLFTHRKAKTFVSSLVLSAKYNIVVIQYSNITIIVRERDGSFI